MRIACNVLAVNKTRSPYAATRNAENHKIVQWLIRLTGGQINWGWRLYFLSLCNVMGFTWCRKLVCMRYLPELATWRSGVQLTLKGNWTMKKRFNEEQIIGFLREADSDPPINKLCRKHGFSERLYCRWNHQSTEQRSWGIVTDGSPPRVSHFQAATSNTFSFHTECVLQFCICYTNNANINILILRNAVHFN